MKIIHFLGYGKSQTKIINLLEARNCIVSHSKDKISLENVDGNYLIISFGYRHLLNKQFIKKCNCPIINLHISYLPFNRGAHPNFWSFYDNTQSGVTIHLVDEGIDTGPILLQKEVKFNDEKTFSETYNRLIVEVENLFIDNIEPIIERRWIEKKQIGKGTFHLIGDLPKNFSGWNSNVADEIKRLKGN